jgi:hypothetical protein
MSKRNTNGIGFLLVGGLVLLSFTCKRHLREQPLLLDEVSPVENSVERNDLAADNGRCFVCHFNYSMETLAVSHAQANVGCESCHGSSDAHCSDEDNITPPDVMYPKSEINQSCMECHNRDRINTEHHASLFSEQESKSEFCTDCHGDHRLSYRTRFWNRESGELIHDDKVRMMDER